MPRIDLSAYDIIRRTGLPDVRVAIRQVSTVPPVTVVSPGVILIPGEGRVVAVAHVTQPPAAFNLNWAVANTIWDDFVRANSTTLGKPSDKNRTWTEFNGNLEISSNRLISTASAGVWSLAYVGGGSTVTSARHANEVNGRLLAVGDAIMSMVKKVRDGTQTFYAAIWKAESGGPVVKLVKWVAGAETVLDSVVYGALNEFRRIQCSFKDGVLVAFVDDNELLRKTDGTITTGDTVGVGILNTGQIARDGRSVAVMGMQLPDDFTEPPGATYMAGPRDPAIHPYDSLTFSNRSIGSTAVYTTVASSMGTALAGASGTYGFQSANWTDYVYFAVASDPVGGYYMQWPADGVYREVFRLNVPQGITFPGGTDKNITIIAPNRLEAYEFSGAAYYLDGLRGVQVRRVKLTDSGRYARFHGNREYGQPYSLGLIRAGELTSGIFHVLHLTGDIAKLMNDFVWPANSVGSFSVWDANANVRHGSLLALNAAFDVDGTTTHAKARVIGHAWQDFGGYITSKGSTASLVVSIEGGALGELPSSGDTAFWNAMNTFWKNLKVVTNNSPSSVGGGGTPRVALPARL